ncbi:hypothetical protein ACFQ12_17090, partial [Methylobacterium trifolii]
MSSIRADLGKMLPLTASGTVPILRGAGAKTPPETTMTDDSPRHGGALPSRRALLRAGATL